MRCAKAVMKRTKDGRLYPVTVIDWDELVSGYNRKYLTSFVDEKSLYIGLVGLVSPAVLAKRLGVCSSTIYRRLDYYGVSRSHIRGGANNARGVKRELFLSISADDMAKMTVAEIRKVVGISAGYCCELVHRYKRKYLRLERGWNDFSW